MGFLIDQGKVLSYDKSIKYHKYIKEHAVIQFLNLFKKFGNLQNANGANYWGDELEYQIVNIDKTSGIPRIDLNTDDIFKNLESDVLSIQYEYGRWMVEAIPKNPYRTLCNTGPILENLQARRKAISSLLKDNDILFSAPVFPMLGVNDYYIKPENLANEETKKIIKDENYENNENKNISKEDSEESLSVKTNSYSHSQFLHDEIINTHPRFAALTRNIRLRRGEKVCIKVPIYQDINTSKIASPEEPFPGFIYMDAMGFGMGNCSLQVTFSTQDVKDARYLTDQLAVFAPIFVTIKSMIKFYHFHSWLYQLEVQFLKEN